MRFIRKGGRVIPIKDGSAKPQSKGIKRMVAGAAAYAGGLHMVNKAEPKFKQAVGIALRIHPEKNAHYMNAIKSASKQAKHGAAGAAINLAGLAVGLSGAKAYIKSRKAGAKK